LSASSIQTGAWSLLVPSTHTADAPRNDAPFRQIRAEEQAIDP
jgi:hypothetical protein